MEFENITLSLVSLTIITRKSILECTIDCDKNSNTNARTQVLSRRVRRKLRVWLRKAHEEEAIADSLKIHAHLALLPNSTIDKFMCSSSFVVLWHSKPEITKKLDSAEDVNAQSSQNDPLAIITNAIAPGKTNKGTSKMISFTTPVHEVFQRVHAKRESVLYWTEKLSDRDLDHKLQSIVNVALQESTIEEEEASSKSKKPKFFYGWQAVSTKPMMCQRVVESEHNYPPSTDQYVTVEFPGAELISVYVVFERTCRSVFEREARECNHRSMA